MKINPIKNLFVFLIAAYQKTISPLLGNHCRFFPSCSSYAKEAFERKNPFQAIFLSAQRLMKCHPFHPGGVDTLE